MARSSVLESTHLMTGLFQRLVIDSQLLARLIASSSAHRSWLVPGPCYRPVTYVACFSALISILSPPDSIQRLRRYRFWLAPALSIGLWLVPAASQWLLSIPTLSSDFVLATTDPNSLQRLRIGCYQSFQRLRIDSWLNLSAVPSSPISPGYRRIEAQRSSSVLTPWHRVMLLTWSQDRSYRPVSPLACLSLSASLSSFPRRCPAYEHHPGTSYCFCFAAASSTNPTSFQSASASSTRFILSS